MLLLAALLFSLVTHALFLEARVFRGWCSKSDSRTAPDPGAQVLEINALESVYFWTSDMDDSCSVYPRLFRSSPPPRVRLQALPPCMTFHESIHAHENEEYGKQRWSSVVPCYLFCPSRLTMEVYYLPLC